MNHLLHRKEGALHYRSTAGKQKRKEKKGKEKKNETNNKQFNYSSPSLLLHGAHLL